MLVLRQFRSSEEVGVYFAGGEDAGAGLLHSLRDVRRRQRIALPEYRRAVGDSSGCPAYVAHAIQWTFWPSLAATIAALGAAAKPRCCGCSGPQFVVRLRHRMFIAAIGLVVRSAIGPVERLLNMLGHQHICALAYALRLCHERGAVRGAGAALRAAMARSGTTSISLVFETASCCSGSCANDSAHVAFEALNRSRAAPALTFINHSRPPSHRRQGPLIP